MPSLRSATRSVLAVVVGYAAMVVLITLVQEAWFGGVSFQASSIGVLAIAGIFTFLSAVIGGVICGRVAARRPVLHVLPICLLVIAETIWLVTSGPSTDPLWFEIMAGSSLLVGILAGGWMLRAKLREPAAVMTA